MVKRRIRKVEGEYKSVTILFCYVCEKKIPNKQEVCIGNNTYRHPKCVPGGSRWLKSKLNKITDIYYKKGE